MKNLLDVCLECKRTLPSHRIRYCTEKCARRSEHKVFYPKRPEEVKIKKVKHIDPGRLDKIVIEKLSGKINYQDAGYLLGISTAGARGAIHRRVYEWVEQGHAKIKEKFINNLLK